MGKDTIQQTQRTFPAPTCDMQIADMLGTCLYCGLVTGKSPTCYRETYLYGETGVMGLGLYATRCCLQPCHVSLQSALSKMSK